MVKSKRSHTSLLLWEIGEGIRQRKWYYLIGCVLGALVGMFNIEVIFKVYDDPSLIEVWSGVLKGCGEYNKSGNVIFQLPVEFMIINMLIAFSIGDYASKDLSGYGRQIIIRTQNKVMWWLSKCIWNIFTVITMYVSILFGAAVVWGVMCGTGNVTGVNRSVLTRVMSLPKDYVLPDSMQLIGVIGLAILVSAGISTFQMMLSLYINPLFAVAAVFGIYVISGYYTHSLLIGNYLMLKRSDMFLKGGVDAVTGVILGGSLLLMSIIMGIFFVKHKDMLD